MSIGDDDIFIQVDPRRKTSHDADIVAIQQRYVRLVVFDRYVLAQVELIRAVVNGAAVVFLVSSFLEYAFVACNDEMFFIEHKSTTSFVRCEKIYLNFRVRD